MHIKYSHRLTDNLKIESIALNLHGSSEFYHFYGLSIGLCSQHTMNKHTGIYRPFVQDNRSLGNGETLANSTLQSQILLGPEYRCWTVHKKGIGLYNIYNTVACPGI